MRCCAASTKVLVTWAATSSVLVAVTTTAPCSGSTNRTPPVTGVPPGSPTPLTVNAGSPQVKEGSVVAGNGRSVTVQVDSAGTSVPIAAARPPAATPETTPE